MTDTIYFLTGIFLLILVMWDFFYTTLSGSGAGPLSKSVALSAHRLINAAVSFAGRRIYSHSGLLVNLLVLAVWVILVWLGLYLVFSSDPDAIINSDGRMANDWERLYFTGYTLSTLGVGNFKPTTSLFEILTSLFSFFGFIFFTSSMTYLVSVSSALANKRSLARNIQNLGKNPQNIAHKLLNMDTSYSYQQILSLQEVVDRHAVNQLAYPLIHYYTHPERDVCLSINLVRLDEAISILINSDSAEKLREELGPLHKALTHFLDHLNENFSRSLKTEEESSASLPMPYEISGAETEKLKQRRKILGGLLKSEGFEWEDVNNGKGG